MSGTLWLVGMMGAGKSTVGPLVAATLGLPFVDLDEEIAAGAGRPIPGIFATEGEAGFRAREARAVASVAGASAVVACGGGVVVDPDNAATMRAGGRIVWLDAPPEVLAARIDDAGSRPLLAGGVEHNLRRLAAERDAAYRSAADLRVDADREAQRIADEVVAWWTRS